MLLKDNPNIPKRAAGILAKRGILTDDDLVRILPRRYKDYRSIRPIDQCAVGTENAVKGVLRYVEQKKGARRYLSAKLDTQDSSGSSVHVSIIIFSRVFLFRYLSGLEQNTVVVTGKVTYDEQWGYSMTEPDEIVEAYRFLPGIRPVYKKFSGISETALADMIEKELSCVHEPFEWELMQKTGIIDYKSALNACHHPTCADDIKKGRARLVLNDLLYFSIGLKKSEVPGSSPMYKLNTREAMDKYIASLPYTMTVDQQSVLRRIVDVTQSDACLNMLLQGDVGSGKTVVAISLMMLAFGSGVQSVLMAPREVLAGQHYETIMQTTGLSGDDVVYLRSGMRASERRSALKKIKEGTAKIIVGTHSCISADVEYRNLGVIVTDEEHLFGVEQKASIVRKASAGAHLLSMSATPIPRTLAGVIYGSSKEVAQIKTMPAGRMPIQTAIVAERARVLPFMMKQIESGRQCYVVCPAIDTEDENIVSIDSVEQEYRAYFESRGVKLVIANGGMDRKDADAAVSSFAAGEAAVLLSTTVIEVGVNVPNATCIVIEQADRFGLASLHQLRGRVGRGSYQSYCILRSDDLENERLATIRSTTDGFVIAEEDMKQRGTGDLLGVKQAGLNVYVESMLSHPKTFRYARSLADYCVENGFGNGLWNLYHHE